MWMMQLMVLLACVGPQAHPPATAGEQAAVAAQPGQPPVSFSPLEERVNVLIAESQEADRRDRLVAARELMLAMRNKDPFAQRNVYDYLDEVLKIEERNRPAAIGIEGPKAPIQEEVLEVPTAPLPSVTPPTTTPPTVTPPTETAPTPPAPDATAAIAAARVQLADARYLDAVATLQGIPTADAAALRKEAIDNYARVERERAGHLFIDARALPPGGERIASLRAVRTALASINERFPDNAYAAAIAENVAKVDADLAAAGVKP